jgi:hypothetical protein
MSSEKREATRAPQLSNLGDGNLVLAQRAILVTDSDHVIPGEADDGEA